MFVFAADLLLTSFSYHIVDQSGCLKKHAEVQAFAVIVVFLLPSQVQKVLKLLEKPYDETECYGEEPAEEDVTVAAACSSVPSSRLPYSSKPPLWASELCVT